VAIGAPAVSWADDMTYYFNQTVGSGSVTGSITTDGTIGTLGSADILGWYLVLKDGGATIILIPSQSGVLDFGPDLTASTTNLMFNFSGACCGEFAIGNPMMPDEGAVVYLTAMPALLYESGIYLVDLDYYFNTSELQSGDQVIATIPEPSTCGLMLLGVGIVFVVRKRMVQGLHQGRWTHRALPLPARY
jgi:hypothetical protein